MSAPASPLKHSSQSINPDEVNAWIGVGSALVALLVWLWRHSLGGFFKWLWNGLCHDWRSKLSGGRTA